MARLTLAFRSPGENFDKWQAAFAALMPDLSFVHWRDVSDPGAVDAVMCWLPPEGWLASFPKLRLVQSLGAGVDHVLKDGRYPAHVPLVRLVDPAMTRAMTDFVTFQVMRLHLGEPTYRRQQQVGLWEPHVPLRTVDRRVGILGLGELGTATAAALVRIGFDVAGWSRTPKDLPQVTCFSGEAGFAPFLARSDILVCLLPLTSATEGILSAATFAQMPQGAGLINVGRGGHLVEADLLAALDSGQLSEAVLDVFQTEPLPEAHPFWTHSRIVVTPHVAAVTNPATASLVVADNLRRLQAGEGWPDRVDLASGY
ncbi:MAG TPA: glyoxylate/hydroxypyruvate reductase A [Aliidongia sp.]|uniref:2-hydroxyacid dehydrogenase n=1 Tax=Aliidongia sp. TaxID=1914230 RepID=UPI002DDD9615|nr:glyoxylate/hydroxypyruvate reductase A [Aliidongia sp.]HEV2675778.1 glyoxylate/hydroxypyruvate reductase A [Aliidongia sp.]